MSWIVQNLWLIPALPLLAAGLSALAPQRFRKCSASLAIGSMALAFLLSLCAFAHTLVHGGNGEIVREVRNIDWFVLGETTLKLGWVLDPLTAVMLVMVTFVGMLIFIYSVGYMAHDENFTRFFCFMSLFAAAMLGVVIANSLLLLFISWELVGLTSYLLIGFWYRKPSAAAAAKKAFITTRIGDMGFFLGILWLYSETGTLLFYDGGNGCLEQSALTKLVSQTTGIGMAVSTGIALLIFCGAVGKSGQVPLHVWLPDAMEGPTPVSALIHAATMVAAGVFLVARVYPLMEATPHDSGHSVVQAAQSDARPHPGPLPREREKQIAAAEESKSVEVSSAHQFGSVAPNGHPLLGGEGRGEGERSANQDEAAVETAAPSTALQVVVWIGAITALFAALIAVAQSDIKRILAYSTVSQLGLMMLGLGVGGVAVGMFHLLTHAFFKALLFLGAGSVIHGCHDEQDIRRMGGLGRFMPVTFATYAVGMMALSGVPLLFSGFWSKDDILHAAWLWQPSKWPFALAIVGAFLTAFYMTRQVCLVFFGEYRGRVGSNAADSARTATPPNLHAEDHASGSNFAPHESPRVMTLPLIMLAVFAVLLGFIGTPLWPWLQTYLTGHHESVSMWGVVALMLVSAAIVLAGIGLGGILYGLLSPQTAEDPDPLERWQPSVFAILRDKFYIDELYEVTVVHMNAQFSRSCRWLDEVVLGTIVTMTSYLIIGVSWLGRVMDEYVVNLAFDRACERLRRGGGLLSRMQDGQVQHYLRVIGLALVAFLLLLTWGWAK